MTTARRLVARILPRALPLTAVLLLAASAAAQPPRAKAALALEADRTAYLPGSTAGLTATIRIEPGWHVNSNTPTYDWLIATELDLALPDGWTVEARYPEGLLRRFAFETEQPLSVYEGETEVAVTVEIPASAAEGPVPINARLIYQACDDRSCLPPTETTAQLDLVVGPGGVATAPATATAPPSRRAGRGLGLLLLLGAVGGLILNAMPCVLPVLSLKLFGLVQSGSRGRGEVVAGALATAAGIVVSFWALAAAAVAARAAGASFGWGVQFQEPLFVVFLTIVVLLFCLNLWGIFEVPLPSRLAGLAGGSREGLPGHFTSGLFATLMATPCSAPFLGTAMGFALGQPAPTVFGMFTAVGVGMAVPYLLIALSPGVLRWIPRPGPWMDALKTVMGFLLAGAALWLLYVLAGQVSRSRLAFVELALLVLALFVWARSRSGGRWGRALAGGGVVLAVIAALALAAGGRGEGASTGAAAVEQRVLDWVVFDRTEAERLARDEGRLVFVDVTADWCFTCKVNERLVLETAETAALFERYQVIPMRADWTNRDEAIGSFLADHGRYGIPFYLLYAPRREPFLFGELLTRSAVREAVEDAAAEARPAAAGAP